MGAKLVGFLYLLRRFLWVVLHRHRWTTAIERSDGRRVCVRCGRKQRLLQGRWMNLNEMVVCRRCDGTGKQVAKGSFDLIVCELCQGEGSRKVEETTWVDW